MYRIVAGQGGVPLTGVNTDVGHSPSTVLITTCSWDIGLSELIRVDRSRRVSWACKRSRHPRPSTSHHSHSRPRSTRGTRRRWRHPPAGRVVASDIAVAIFQVAPL